MRRRGHSHAPKFRRNGASGRVKRIKERKTTAMGEIKFNSGFNYIRWRALWTLVCPSVCKHSRRRMISDPPEICTHMSFLATFSACFWDSFIILVCLVSPYRYTICFCHSHATLRLHTLLVFNFLYICVSLFCEQMTEAVSPPSSLFFSPSQTWVELLDSVTNFSLACYYSNELPPG